MQIGVPSETHHGERRVAATPRTTRRLIDLGFAVAVQAGAGLGAGFTDQAYAAAGATVVERDVLYATADIVLRVEAPSANDVVRMRRGSVLLALLFPKRNEAVIDALAERGITALAMDMVPRITRAQKLDALSSMANIAGYRAVVEAANAFGSFFSGQFTAAGKVPPATVLVIGAGVAGLAAIAAARGLGAQVRAFDTREAVKGEVESLGGTFLALDFEEDGDGQGGYAKIMSPAFIAAEMALFREQAQEVDVVITTALVPGAKAPTLWEAEAVAAMKQGSVVVDLAAAQGGNCALTVAGEAIDHDGVTVIGYTDLPSRMAPTASQLYGTNVVHVLDELGGADAFQIDQDNVIARSMLVTHQGAVTYPPPPLPAPTPPRSKAPVVAATPAPPRPAAPRRSSAGGWIFGLVGLALAGLWLAMMVTADHGSSDRGTREFVQHLTVFVMACFVGWQVIWNVSPALHTPLMSVTNAISGIIIVGGILEGARGADLSTAVVLGLIAAFIATINIAGGFWVSQRMLKMFRKE